MTDFHVAFAFALIAVNLAGGLWGGYGWWRRRHARGFWPLLRIGQAMVMLQAVQGAVLILMGRDLPELHLIYGLVPIGVSFMAEQLRLAAADTVLAQRGLEGRADVEALPESEQRALVNAILRREMGVMAASALVVSALALRAL